jgi:hypothetical protein
MTHRIVLRRTLPLLLLLLLLTACFAMQPDVALSLERAPAGFLFGLWHGFISPIAFVFGIFSDVRIYAVPNTGLWYDFGFMLGIGGFSSGIFASKGRKD